MGLTVIPEAPAADMQPGAVAVVATITVERKAHFTPIWILPVLAALAVLALACLAALALLLLLLCDLSTFA